MVEFYPLVVALAGGYLCNRNYGHPQGYTLRSRSARMNIAMLNNEPVKDFCNT